MLFLVRQEASHIVFLLAMWRHAQFSARSLALIVHISERNTIDIVWDDAMTTQERQESTRRGRCGTSGRCVVTKTGAVSGRDATSRPESARVARPGCGCPTSRWVRASSPAGLTTRQGWGRPCVSASSVCHRPRYRMKRSTAYPLSTPCVPRWSSLVRHGALPCGKGLAQGGGRIGNGFLALV